MDVEYKIPLKRHSLTFMFYGQRGSGKTLAMAYFALYYYLKGYTIYSNVHLNIPYTPIKDMEDLKKIQRGVALLDDFELWASSKFHTNKEKKELLQQMIFFGKRDIIQLLSCKRPLELDKSTRASGCDFFVKCKMRLKETPKSIEEYEEMSNYLDAHVIEMEVYDGVTLKLDRITVLDNLDIYCELYDTKEEIKTLEKQEVV